MPEPGLWLGGRPILLASASATRRGLLEAVGLPVEAEASSIDERAVERTLETAAPAEIAAHLADAKALAVSARRPDRVVVGADQVLELDGEAFAKAADLVEAGRQLARLSGRTHTLLSAVSIAQERRIESAFLCRAALTMRPLSSAEIARYIALAGQAATRSVGGYEVEGFGLHLFERIEGEHSTILGLPMLPLLAALRRMGLVSL